MFDFKQKLQIRNKTNSIVLHHAAASVSVAASAAEILNIPQPLPYYAFVWKYYLEEGKASTTYTFTKQRYGKDVFVFAYALNRNGEMLKFKTLA